MTTSASPLARLLQQWQRTPPSHRVHVLIDAARATPGSVVAAPGLSDTAGRWLISLHGVTGTGPSSSAAMRDWAAGALQAVARETRMQPQVQR